MLYDEENEKKELMIVEEQEKLHLRKKTLICGSIILACLFIMGISLCLSYQYKKNRLAIQQPNLMAEQKDKKVDQKQIESYTGKHKQIQKHDVAQIKSKFVPKQNPNAQEQITNIYYSPEKVAYLTFDDGPSKNITPQILDILKQEQVPATFFVLGSRVELNPDLLKREFDEGHYIANHGYSHQYSQIYRSKDTVFEEYIKCENAIRNALDNQEYNTYLFRFPGGSSGGRYEAIKTEAKELLHSYGVNYTNWNCLTGDAEGKTTPEELIGCLEQTMQGDGSIIILMHDASDKSYTVQALPMVISHLRDKGYTFKSFYEIF